MFTNIRISHLNGDWTFIFPYLSLRVTLFDWKINGIIHSNLTVDLLPINIRTTLRMFLYLEGKKSCLENRIYTQLVISSNFIAEYKHTHTHTKKKKYVYK